MLSIKKGGNACACLPFFVLLDYGLGYAYGQLMDYKKPI